MNNHQSNNKITKTCKKSKKAAKSCKTNLVRGKKLQNETESGSKEICNVYKLFQMATGRCKNDYSCR